MTTLPAAAGDAAPKPVPIEDRPHTLTVGYTTGAGEGTEEIACATLHAAKAAADSYATSGLWVVDREGLLHRVLPHQIDLITVQRTAEEGTAGAEVPSRR